MCLTYYLCRDAIIPLYLIGIWHAYYAYRAYRPQSRVGGIPYFKLPQILTIIPNMNCELIKQKILYLNFDHPNLKMLSLVTLFMRTSRALTLDRMAKQ